MLPSTRLLYQGAWRAHTIYPINSLICTECGFNKLNNIGFLPLQELLFLPKKINIIVAIECEIHIYSSIHPHFPVQATDTLVIDLEPFALDQDVQSPVAEAPALAGELDQALLKPILLPL